MENRHPGAALWAALLSLLVAFNAQATATPHIPAHKNKTAAVRTSLSPAQEAEQFYHQIWSLVNQNFLYRNRLSDWPAWEHKFDGQLPDLQAAQYAIDSMLDSLNDPYTYFNDAKDTLADNLDSNASGVVAYRMLPGKIGYVNITEFNSMEANEAEDAFHALSNARAYILDLRDNPGGYCDQAALTFSLFVNSGNFTSVKGIEDGKPDQERYWVSKNEVDYEQNGQLTRLPRKPNLTGNKPLIILVNGDTASAAEMLSGALRDNGRAQLLGTRTFGKGISQIHWWPLSHGTSVQITFARFFLPNGRCVQGKGLKPDYRLKSTRQKQFAWAVRILQHELAHQRK